MEKLIVFLKRFGPLSPELVDHLYTIVTDKTFNRNEEIQREGRVCHHIWFIEWGLIRIYRNGTKAEVTLWLLKGNEVFIATDSFFCRMPSKENIVTMEKTLVWGITHDQLLETIRLFPEFNTHLIMINAHYRKMKDDREALWRDMSVKERVEWMKMTEPYIASRIGNEILCSYLGISISSLKNL
jgi:CRP-like cAMP-binding protein